MIAKAGLGDRARNPSSRAWAFVSKRSVGAKLGSLVLSSQVSEEAHVKSRQMQIAALSADANLLLGFCFERGARCHTVVPLEFTPTKPGVPSIDFDNGRCVQFRLRFDDLDYASKIGTIELSFEGITQNDQFSGLGASRIYCHELDYEFPEIPPVWEQLTKYVKRTFTRKPSQRPRGLGLWVGPSAEQWLAQPDRVIAFLEDYGSLALPRPLC
jgi:hypothetical protein